MSRYVLDASAVLAIICNEPGSEGLTSYTLDAYLSAVNLAEVYSKSSDVGLSEKDINWAVSCLQLEVVPFDELQAQYVGSLRESTRELGLSLGDRACLALGLAMKQSVVTADRSWTKLSLKVDVIDFRNAA